ncbi:MAG: adenylosuccinate lyase [bacterium]
MIERYTTKEMNEIWSEENKFSQMLKIEILACEFFAKTGKIPNEAVEIIKKKAKFDIKRIAEIEEQIHHDIIAFLTNVSENVGEESRYIHQGLTSSDILDTSLSYLMKQASIVILKKLTTLKEILKSKALEYKNTVMIGRTHGIHAEPMTFGLKMALWMKETERNIERMKRAQEVISYGKISGAVGTFAHVDIEIEKYVCSKMGLKSASISTQVLQRDRHAEYLTTIAIIGASLEKFAIEIRNLQRTDIGEASEPFGEKQKGSSAMPHKKNPIICERITGLARILRSNAMASLENIALWHERDISHSSVERIIIPDSTILLDYMLQKFINVINGLNVYSEKMLENVNKTQGLIFSQRILLALTQKNISREDAYLFVQRNSMKSMKEKKELKTLCLKDKDIKKHLSSFEIEECFDIKYYLKNIDNIYKRLEL